MFNFIFKILGIILFVALTIQVVHYMDHYSKTVDAEVLHHPQKFLSGKISTLHKKIVNF